MKKNKIKQKIFHEQQEEDSDQGELGRLMGRKDYITLKKNKIKPITPNQQHQHSVQLFRNEELNKYLAQIDKQDKNINKKQKNKNYVDPRTEVLQNVIFNLKSQRNVCLTGGMDKMQLMDDIVKFLQQKQQNVFVIYGYSQPINQKKIYNAFGSHLIRSGIAKTIDHVLIKDQLQEYQKILSETSQNTIIYVVFYDLSNYGFASSEMQTRLAQLLSLPRLRLIASVQNCKIVLTWSFQTLSMFNFVFVNANKTCIPITKILKYLPLPNQKSQKTQLQIIQIWKSLNRNQRQIAVILAQNQMNNILASATQQNYLSFQQLLDACIDKVILSDDHQLRENLIQLTDHKVVIQQIDKTKNKKVFIMKLDRRILENMINGHYDNYQS